MSSGAPGDAGPRGDGGMFPGDGMEPPGGGGCGDAEGDRPAIWLAAFEAAFAFRSRRRRGTKTVE